MLLGVKYTPVAFQEQVVAGMNYNFLCNSEVVIPNSTNQAVIRFSIKYFAYVSSNNLSSAELSRIYK